MELPSLITLVGEEIFVIDAADNALIAVGDDFGFSGNTF